MSSIRELINQAQSKLKNTKSPQLDSEVLLSYIIGKPREYILAHFDEDVPGDKVEQFEKLIARREKHEPVAYLTKRKEFYGRDFYVDKRAHIPRPATEDLIDYIKASVPPDFNGSMADIGTGSGCIAITLAHEFPEAKIIATDACQDALDVAQKNAVSHQVENRIAFLKGNLLEPLPGPVDILVSNPPYGWHYGWTNDPEIEFQPTESYIAGNNGLDCINDLLADMGPHLNKRAKAFIEFDPRQKDAITQLLNNSTLQFFKYAIKKDLSGFDRILRLTT